MPSSCPPSAIPAPPSVIPAPPSVIPANAGIHRSGEPASDAETPSPVTTATASAPDHALPPPPVLIIEPARGWVPVDLRSLWAYRELLYFLTWRDIKVRYKQTALGAAWAIIQPFFSMIVFTIVFGRLAKVGSDGAPYPIFSYAGLLPWMFFANAMTVSSNSLVGSQNLISKVYFPRLVIPISATLAGVVDFAIAFVVLLGMMLWYGVTPGPGIVVLPFFLLLALGAALSVGLWLSALNVEYRDVRYTIPFITQFWMFASPVVYPASLVPAKYRALYALNPMVGVIEGFRWAVLGTGQPPGLMTLVSIFAALALLTGGAYYFRRMERTFADVV